MSHLVLGSDRSEAGIICKRFADLRFANGLLWRSSLPLLVLALAWQPGLSAQNTGNNPVNGSQVQLCPSPKLDASGNISAPEDGFRLSLPEITDTQSPLEKHDGAQQSAVSRPSLDAAKVDPPISVSGPDVRYEAGQLLIDPRRSSLQTVLAEVSARTGVVVDAPPEAGQDAIFGKVGPAPLRDALSELLYGTGFNYILVTSSTDPQMVRKVMVFAQTRTKLAAASNEPNTAAANQPEENGLYGGVEAAKDAPPPPEAAPLTPVNSKLDPSTIPGVPQGFNLKQAAAEAHKTPGEILSDLQRRQIELLDAQSPPP